MQVCIDKLEELVLQRKKTSEDMGDCTMTGNFVEQELDSLYNPSLDLDLTKFSELDTSCTYDSNICDKINSSISLVSFSLTYTNPLLNKDPLLGTDPFSHKEITYCAVVGTLRDFEKDDLFKNFDFSELSSVDNTFISDSCTDFSIFQICLR